MKRAWSLVVFLVVAVSAFAQQSRDDINIFIAPVVASPDQAAYFHDNFSLETRGAGYAVTENSGDADYTLRLEVHPNMILYEDGTEELAPPDEPQFVLNIHLVRNEDDVEIVAFSFPFTDVEEMYDYNLYLLYEAMANVPFTKGGEADERWRNKWMYFRASLDYPIAFYALKGPPFLTEDTTNHGDPNNPQLTPLNHRISPWLAATVGVEFQYLYWMSTEVNFNISFHDPMSETFVPSVQIEQKFPIKPAGHIYFMIQPYAVVSFPINTSPDVIEFPTTGVGGGVQFGVKGGSMGAFFLDVNYIHYIGEAEVKNRTGYDDGISTIKYGRFVIGLGIGYKIGFFDRKMPKPKEQ